MTNSWTLGSMGTFSRWPEAIDQESGLSIRWLKPGNKEVKLVEYSLIHSFSPCIQTFTEHLLYAQHRSKDWGFTDKNSNSFHGARRNGTLSI